jgi:hypothetical protein
MTNDESANVKDRMQLAALFLRRINTEFKMNEELAAVIRMEEAGTCGGVHREDKNRLQSPAIPAMKLTGLVTSGTRRGAGNNSEVSSLFITDAKNTADNDWITQAYHT